MTRSAGTTARLPGLDILRGLAVLLVLLRHSWPHVFGSAGMVGVVVFFTLSGYLITGVLLRDISSSGGVRYGRFYRNRALRLLPPLALMLIGLTVVTVVADPLSDGDGLARALVVAMTYTADIPFFDHGSVSISHLWTLAAEEQFYLVWPLILVLAVRIRQLGAALLVCGVTIVLILAASMHHAAPEIEGIYTLPTSWCVAMVIGAAAFVARERLRTLMARPSSRLIATAAFCAVAIAAAMPEDKGSPWTYFLLGPTSAVASAFLIVALSRWRVPPRPLEGLRALGLISYAAYLWNYPIALWVGGGRPTSIEGVLILLLTVFAATVSWFTVERPIARWRKPIGAMRAPAAAASSAHSRHDPTTD